MRVSNLTGRQRVRILMLALAHHTADEIAEVIDVPEDVIRKLCYGAGVKLAESKSCEKGEC